MAVEEDDEAPRLPIIEMILAELDANSGKLSSRRMFSGRRNGPNK